MRIQGLSTILRSTVLVVATIAIVTSGTGCAAFGRAWSALIIHIEESHDLAEIRRDTREELAEQREEARREAAENEVEQARYEAERARWEQEFCRCNEQAAQERLRSNIREEVESKIAFNVRQGLEIGELEVDTEKLREMLVEREKQPVQAPPPPPCPCCDKPCNCGSGWLRRHCPRCRHKHCEAEKDCGGPEALAQLERQPLRQPLRPAEIPLKLPVYLSFGMQQPEMERARIRREAIIEQPPHKPCAEPCPNYYQRGLQQMPCAKPVPEAAPANPPPVVPASPGPLPANVTPPVPIADPSEQARLRSSISIQPSAFFLEQTLPRDTGSWHPPR
jgi:hypothetical protein